MKIEVVNENFIKFDNGSYITYHHKQDCCECNYADFIQIEDLIGLIEFTNQIEFEEVDGHGFRFGNKKGHMIFVPCYSEQNGYYSSDIDILYNGKLVLNLDCEERIY